MTMHVRRAMHARGPGTSGRPLAAFTVGAVLLALGSGCREPAEDAQDLSLHHLEAAIGILEAHAGQADEAIAALGAYLDAHREEMLATKARGITALERMSPSKREAFRANALERTRPLRERLDTLARTFPEPHRILRILRQFQ